MKFIVTLALLISIASIANAQSNIKGSKYALVFPRNADGIAGNIIRIDPDTVVIFDTAFHYLSKKDIVKVILHPAKPAFGQGFVIGSLIGTYSILYYSQVNFAQPGAFINAVAFGSSSPYVSNSYSSNNASGFWTIFLGVLIGGGIGYAADHPRGEDVVYIFDPRDISSSDDAWEEIESLAGGHPRQKRIYRVSISGGSVISTVQNKYYDELTALGYSIGHVAFSSQLGASFSKYNYIEGPSDVNILRSFSLSRKISDHIEVGAAAGWFGEPTYAAVLGNNNTFSLIDDRISFAQRYDARGYYATGGYSFFLDKNEQFEVLGGIGVGAAIIKFDLDAFSEHTEKKDSVSYQSDHFEIHKTTFSAMATAGISYYAYDALSFELSANYFYGGSATARAIPIASISEHPLVFQNIDLGLKVALHF